MVCCVKWFYMCFSLLVWRLPAADAGRPSQVGLWPQAGVPESTSGPQPLWRHPSPQRLGTALHTLLRCRWVCVRSPGSKIDWWLTTVPYDIQQQSINSCCSESTAVCLDYCYRTKTVTPRGFFQCECQYELWILIRRIQNKDIIGQ